mmetsp:Transcript_3617/g.7317  ORF Transcript_3617/g.7317 Transcript_3617/m.7317 type:complete len:279 (+) Transcript_3617:81-917(+)
MLRILVLMMMTSQENPFNKLSSDIIAYSLFPFLDESFSLVDRSQLSVLNVSTIKSWPDPMGIKVNMMPFDPRKKESLPERCQAYWDIISLCIEHSHPHNIREVAYLTIEESWVKEGSTQRRGGLHTETPGVLVGHDIAPKPKFSYHHWGHGSYSHGTVKGGIYMASNVTNSTLFYDAEIKKEKMAKVPNGDCRFLRKYLGNPIFSRADMIYWMTDRTPHEALPTPSGPRQFIRVIFGGIDLWFSEHSTPNPLVKLPSSVRVLTGNKFNGEIMEVKRES